MDSYLFGRVLLVAHFKLNFGQQMGHKDSELGTWVARIVHALESGSLASPRKISSQAVSKARRLSLMSSSEIRSEIVMRAPSTSVSLKC